MLRASSYEPGFGDLARLASKSLVKVSMRASWLCYGDLGNRIATLRPGYWDENGMNFCEISAVFSRNL